MGLFKVEGSTLIYSFEDLPSALKGNFLYSDFAAILLRSFLFGDLFRVGLLLAVTVLVSSL